MFYGINAIQFNRQFKTNEDCLDYLFELKWGKGFSCSRCGGQKPVKGRTSYHRRCQRCCYDESVIANTLFHAMKMPILKAFHLVFRVSVKKKGMSTVELGNEVSVQQKTAWLFKRKIQIAMKQDHHYKLKGQVDVDETLMGFHTTRLNGGRSLLSRMALIIAVEILPGGKVGNMRMQQIENFKALTLKYAIKDTVCSSAQIRTDNYCSYRTLKNEGMNITNEGSEKGKAFELLHRQIMLFKNWVVGIHHRWSKNHLYAYADEYVYRFNHRNERKRIFNLVIKSMMHQIQHPLPVIKTLCAYST